VRDDLFLFSRSKDMPVQLLNFGRSCYSTGLTLAVSPFNLLKNKLVALIGQPAYSK